MEEYFLMVDRPTYEQLEQRVKTLEMKLAERKKEESSLRAIEERLSQILRETSIPTFVIDNNHIVTHINKAYENLTGILADEIIGTRKQWLCFYATERPTMADLIVDNASEEKIARRYQGNYHKSAVTEGGYEAERLFAT